MPRGLGGGNLVRFAKSRNQWGSRQLAAFNIKVVDVDAQTFFGNSVLPEPMVSSVILNNLEGPTTVTLNKADMDFFGYMEDATMNSPNEQTFVVDFAAFILRMMHYDQGHRLVQVRKKMEFEMRGQCVETKVDVCIFEHSAAIGKHLLLMQENKVCKPYLCVLKICLPIMCQVPYVWQSF